VALESEEVTIEEDTEEDLTDEQELIAVITAAIAASQGKEVVEGLVVKSFKKINRH
jgi:hypothetical protein